MNKYIFYGAPFHSKARSTLNAQGKRVGKPIVPYVIKEFASLKKALKYLDRHRWNLLYETEELSVQFVVLNVEEVKR